MDIKKMYGHIYAHKITKPSEEQIRYALILSKSMKIGLAILFITYFLYITDIISSYVPKSLLSQIWHLPVSKYLQTIGVQPGWSWVYLITKGDFINFVGIAFLSGISILCFISIIPIFIRKRDIIYAAIALIEVLVLIFAASGILKTGGH